MRGGLQRKRGFVGISKRGGRETGDGEKEFKMSHHKQVKA